MSPRRSTNWYRCADDPRDLLGDVRAVGEQHGFLLQPRRVERRRRKRTARRSWRASCSFPTIVVPGGRDTSEELCRSKSRRSRRCRRPAAAPPTSAHARRARRSRPTRRRDLRRSPRSKGFRSSPRRERPAGTVSTIAHLEPSLDRDNGWKGPPDAREASEAATSVIGSRAADPSPWRWSRTVTIDLAPAITRRRSLAAVRTPPPRARREAKIRCRESDGSPTARQVDVQSPVVPCAFRTPSCFDAHVRGPRSVCRLRRSPASRRGAGRGRSRSISSAWVPCSTISRFPSRRSGRPGVPSRAGGR